MFTRTYRVAVAVKLRVTVLPLAGLKSRPAEVTMVVNVPPSALPCTDRVCVRAPQLAGSLSTTWSTLVLAPRSTWAHCGKALPALSQYEFWLPSLRLPGTNEPFVLLVVAVLPSERLGPPAAWATLTHPRLATRTRAAEAALIRFDRL